MSDNQSMLSTTSSVKKRISKHCNEDECNGKKISGQEWSRHKKTIHEKEDV
jgi:hypothetical protein